MSKTKTETTAVTKASSTTKNSKITIGDLEYKLRTIEREIVEQKNNLHSVQALHEMLHNPGYAQSLINILNNAQQLINILNNINCPEDLLYRKDND